MTVQITHYPASQVCSITPKNKVIKQKQASQKHNNNPNIYSKVQLGKLDSQLVKNTPAEHLEIVGFESLVETGL